MREDYVRAIKEFDRLYKVVLVVNDQKGEEIIVSTRKEDSKLETRKQS